MPFAEEDVTFTEVRPSDLSSGSLMYDVAHPKREIVEDKQTQALKWKSASIVSDPVENILC